MKKSFLLLTGLLAIAGAAAAQAPATGPGPALASPRGLVTPNQLIERRTQYLAKELGVWSQGEVGRVTGKDRRVLLPLRTDEFMRG